MTLSTYWVAWWEPDDNDSPGPDTPWWVTGEERIRYVDARNIAHIDGAIVAVVRAIDENHAKEQIRKEWGHDGGVDWIACERKPEGWSPFSERYPRAPWMVWD